MSTKTILPAPGDRIADFLVLRVREIPAIRAIAVEAEHEATGMPWLHLAVDDAEKMFALAVRTPPPDDTGLPHILEHTVLCGSKRFPVKDPFVELLKSSLATFINAMTYPDRTLYPVATLSDRDFYNLAAVYADAVFHPLLREDHFLQEGWRLGFEPTGDAQGIPVIKGIVYNEMKGAYSDLDGAIERAHNRGLLPGTIYGNDSGGDPAQIPSLDYASFTAFHRRWYHPSNSAACTYGSLPWADQAAFLQEHLRGFQRQEPLPVIPPALRWQQPRSIAVTYPMSADEDASSAEAVTVTWLCAPITDRLRWLALHALDGYLLGHDGAPLYRALIGSGLGKALAPSGLSDHNRDTSFTVGLKGCRPGNSDAVLACILDCLRHEVTQGLNEELLAGALHQMEIGLRSIGGQWPLTVMSRVFQRWLYGDDPCAGLDLDAPFTELRTGGITLLTQVLREELLENPHRLQVLLVPDALANATEAAAESARAQALAAQLTTDERNRLAERDAELEQRQAQPNRPEDLATLPRLSLADVPKTGIEPRIATQKCGDHTLVHVDLPANGLTHTALALDLGAVADQEWELVPILIDCLRSCGAGGLDSATLATQQSLVSSSLGVRTALRRRAGEVRLYLHLSLAALPERLPAALDLISKRLQSLDLNDHARVSEVVRERLGTLRAGLVSNGSGYAASRATRQLGVAHALSERCDGLTQIQQFTALASAIDGAGISALAERLQGLAQRLQQAPLTAAAVGTTAELTALRQWLQNQPFQSAAAGCPDLSQPAISIMEGIAIASDVAFVARAAPGPDLDHADAPALLVLANMLRTGYLWERIRVQGGAYGAQLSVDLRGGVLTATTYRDPHIKRSLAVFDGLAAHVATELDLSAQALELAIIGAIKNIDRPLRPAGAADLVLHHHLNGSTSAQRQAFRERLLALTPDQMHSAGTRWLTPLEHGPVCVLAGRPLLERAVAEGLPIPILAI